MMFKIKKNCTLLLIITPILLFSKQENEKSFFFNNKLLCELNHADKLGLNSIKDVFLLYSETTKDKSNITELKEIFKCYHQTNIDKRTALDSCYLLMKYAFDLQHNSNHIESIKLQSYLHDYLSTCDYSNREVLQKLTKVKLNISKIYSENAIWIKALDYLGEAKSIAIQLDESEILFDILINIASVYYQQKSYEMAKKTIFSALKIITENTLKNKKGLCFNNLGVIYTAEKNHLIALNYFNKSKELLNQSPNKNIIRYCYIYSNLSDLYNKTGQFQLALQHNNEVMPYMHKISKTLLIDLLKTRINIYWQFNKIDSCKIYMNKLLLFNDLSINQRKNISEFFYNFYIKTENYKKACFYSKKLTLIKDSIELTNKHFSLELFNSTKELHAIKLENSLNKELLEYKNNHIKQKNTWFSIVIIILFLTITLLFQLFRTRKREIKALINNTRIKENLQKKENELLLYNEKELTKKIDYKNRQLTSITLQNARYNQFTLNIMKELQNLYFSIKKNDTLKRKTISLIINDLRNFTYGNNWKEFKMYFEEVHPTFYKKLMDHSPKLTQNELKICAFIKLGLTNKEIAAITFRETRTIESARNRLRKKFPIKNDDTLFNYLSDNF